MTKLRWYEYRRSDPDQTFHKSALATSPNYARVLQFWVDSPVGGYWQDVPLAFAFDEPNHKDSQ